MKLWRAIRALGGIDAKSIGRDPLLRWMILFPLLLAVLVRWGMPLLDEFLSARYAFDLAPYHPLLMSFVLTAMPMLSGMVIGFLLLDQRDDRTLSAIQVTPLALNGYLVYRLSLPMALSLASTLVLLPMTGYADLGFLSLGLAALAAAPVAPFYALSLGAFAGNKVQGFALTKAMGVLLAIPVAAWFAREPWQWAFGLVPLYWPAKAYWMLEAGSGRGGVALLVVAGCLYQAVIVAGLFRWYRSRVTS